jgi:hypothetical protein
MFLTASLAACSSAARTAPPAVASAAPPQAAPKALVAGHASPTTAPDAAAIRTDEVDPSLLKAGYKVMRYQGQILYCRTEVLTGQRIGTRVCLSAAQLQAEKQNVTKARDIMNGGNNRCLPADLCTK